ncbi:MAG: hypothetical protein AAF628_07940 [Planctomycetota bacterium]
MTETLADALKTGCRTAFLLGNVLLFTVGWFVLRANQPEDLPFTCVGAVRVLTVTVICIGGGLVLGSYLSLALGVDVFGLNRLLGVPRGRPFHGLQDGEEERLQLRWSAGGVGRTCGYAFGMKMLLTTRRLLLGTHLSSWFVYEFSLADVRSFERRKGAWATQAVRLHFHERPARPHVDVWLARAEHRDALAEQLEALSIPTEAGD